MYSILTKLGEHHENFNICSEIIPTLIPNVQDAIANGDQDADGEEGQDADVVFWSWREGRP